MLFQQMKSTHSFKIEENGTMPTPSITVADNDILPNTLPTDHRSRLKENLYNQSTTNNNSSNCNNLPLVHLSGKTPTVRSRLRENLHDRWLTILSSYNSIHQSQPTRFSFETNSNGTSLNKLWYTYSYIYKPTTIRYGFNSLHSSPLHLLSSLKHAATPFSPTILFTTNSIL